MERMEMKSMDLIRNNIDLIGEAFPSCLTESKDKNGKLCRRVDFEKLRACLGEAPACLSGKVDVK